MLGTLDESKTFDELPSSLQARIEKTFARLGETVDHNDRQIVAKYCKSNFKLSLQTMATCKLVIFSIAISDQEYAGPAWRKALTIMRRKATMAKSELCLC